MTTQTEVQKAENPWERGLYMLLFFFIYSAAEVVMAVLVLIQFVMVIINKHPEERLKSFGKDLSGFIYQVFLFLTFNSEEKPFPFKPWQSSITREEND